MPQRLSFLFGSGISIPANFPSVADITKIILTGNGVMRHTNGNYSFGPPLNGFPDEHVPKVVDFLKKLSEEITKYHSREANYEDLYYVAAQIHDSESGKYDNPVVDAFIEKIIPKNSPLLVGKTNEIKRQWNIQEIAEEATHYIIGWFSFKNGLRIHLGKTFRMLFIHDFEIKQGNVKCALMANNRNNYNIALI
ncbi:MAG: hypothetical protein HQM08_30775 [Candidatus Riflebacteria bacterium]|nr:hypothetical protein [Candidatus Riflebacteria bacterium]